MIPNLSSGGLKKILDGEALESVVLQVLGYKLVPGNSNNRFRLLLNDGNMLFPYAILATSLNYLIDGKHLEKYTIVKLKQYVCDKIVGERKIIVCLNIEVILPGSEVCHKISDGNLSESWNDSSAPTQLLTITPTKACDVNTSVKNKKFSFKQLCPGASTSSGNNTNCNISFSHGVPICPISNLTPYQNKWVLRTRVIYKSPVVNYNNERGSGIFISVQLLDNSGQIKATAFNECARKLQDLLQLDKIYFIAHAQIQQAKNYSLVGTGFELTINETTKIEEYFGDAEDFPKLLFNFQLINQIVSHEKDSLIDIIGICYSFSEKKQIFTRKDYKEIFKRDIDLVDTSESVVTVSLWGADADRFQWEKHSVIAIKNAKVSDFHGHSLNVSPLSMIFLNPDIPETYALNRWFNSLSNTTVFQTLSSDIIKGSQAWKTFAEINCEDQNQSGDADYYSVKAIIIMVQKEKCMYQACPAVDCFKKVELIEGSYKCKKCNKAYTNFKWTCFLSVNLADFTDSHWAVAFRDTAESLIGIKSEELNSIKENDEDKYYEVLSELHFKCFIFNLRSKVETYNETSSLKTTILNVNNVDPVSYTKKMLSDIKRFSTILNHT